MYIIHQAIIITYPTMRFLNIKTITNKISHKTAVTTQILQENKAIAQ